MTLTQLMRLSCGAPNSARQIAITQRYGAVVFATIVANPLGHKGQTRSEGLAIMLKYLRLGAM